MLKWQNGDCHVVSLVLAENMSIKKEDNNVCSMYNLFGRCFFNLLRFYFFFLFLFPHNTTNININTKQFNKYRDFCVYTNRHYHNQHLLVVNIVF